MDIKELYEELEQARDKGEIRNAYSDETLSEFYEYIVEEKYKDMMPPWAEAFMQIYQWQFQSMHEGSDTYYTNFYGDSDYETMLRIADYLRQNGYNEVEKLYAPAIIELEGDEYPEDKAYLLPDDRDEGYRETVWHFYVDILEKHKEELL